MKKHQNNKTKNAGALEYQHKDFKKIALVSFIGSLIKKNVNVLKLILDELSRQEELKIILFDYSKVREIGQYIDRDFVQFQLVLREKGIELRHCSLPVSMKRELIRVGTIKKNELRGNLKDAVRELANANAA